MSRSHDPMAAFRELRENLDNVDSVWRADVKALLQAYDHKVRVLACEKGQAWAAPAGWHWSSHAGVWQSNKNGEDYKTTPVVAPYSTHWLWKASVTAVQGTVYTYALSAMLHEDLFL